MPTDSLAPKAAPTEKIFSTFRQTPQDIAALHLDKRPSSQRYWFILNPKANRGKAKSLMESLRLALRARGLETVIQLTTARGEATKFAADAMRKADVVVACGGDGTINEVAQSLIGTNAVMGCVPVGSGNDFSKMLSVAPNNVEDAVSHLFKSSVRLIDVGKVSFENDLYPARYFTNTLGLGFSGRVAREANRLTWLRGLLIYIVAVIKVVAGYKATRMRLTMHTPQGIQTYDDKVFMLSIGNGACEGGQFRTTPLALSDDGLLDVSVLRDISKLAVPLWIMRFMQGSHVGKDGVRYTKASRIEVEVMSGETLHLDGEVFENVSGKLTIDVHPAALRVLAPQVDSK
ncbi:MAG: diacylglycerol kinase family lipid kinase [Rhizobacter sp.]|nr:diacylglycerol kinase family lipid kinase [Chlorobiales bacterium]